MTDTKKNKRPERESEGAPAAEIDWMVTLPHGQSGHEVSFSPEHVFVVDSAGPLLPRPGGGPGIDTTRVQLSDGNVSAIYNVPLAKSQVMARIREKLSLMKGDRALAGIRRQTVNEVVDMMARRVIDGMETTCRAMLDKELPDRMGKFLMDFSRDKEGPDETEHEVRAGS